MSTFRPDDEYEKTTQLLTQEQFTDVVEWLWQTLAGKRLPNDIMGILDYLITAECRNHGYAGIDDAYRVLIEKEAK